MADMDLRPLSLGELLDRTFSLYRRHFLLFVGITAIPQLLSLAMNFAGVLTPSPKTFPLGRPPLAPRAAPPVLMPSGGYLAGLIFGVVVFLLIYLAVYLLAQGATFYAVSEIYMGRSTTIGECLKRMRGRILNLLGVTILNGLAVLGGCILLIIPGIYVSCRLLVCIPAALFEDLGPGESLSRSWELTRDEAGPAFLVLFLYFVLSLVAASIFQFPFTLMLGLSQASSGAGTLWFELAKVGQFLGTVLVTPYLTVATAVFYYNMRVKKEAFDLQVMMSPVPAVAPAAPNVPPTLA